MIDLTKASAAYKAYRDADLMCDRLCDEARAIMWQFEEFTDKNDEALMKQRSAACHAADSRYHNARGHLSTLDDIAHAELKAAIAAEYGRAVEVSFRFELGGELYESCYVTIDGVEHQLF